jgi:predicted dehydrogenase
MSLGVLIVGLGQIGMGYDLGLDPVRYVQTHARAFSQHPAFHLVGAVDPDPQRRDVFAQNYQSPAYADLETALGQHQPGLVVIATPTPAHKDTLLKVLSLAHPQVILCEKPLAYSSEEGRFMVNACLDKGVGLYVNYMRRSVPGFIEVKRLLDAGEIRGPVKGVTWYSKGFVHNGSHFFNLMEYWLGPMQSASVLKKGRAWGADDFEPDVHVVFEKGEMVFLAAWEEAFSHYTVELLCPSGRLRCEQGGDVIQWQAVEALDGHQALSSQPQIIETDMSRYQWHVTDQLACSMAGKQPFLCSGEEALVTLSSLGDFVRTGK